MTSARDPSPSAAPGSGTSASPASGSPAPRAPGAASRVAPGPKGAAQARGADQFPAREKVLGHLAMALFALVISGSFSLGGRAAAHIAPEALNALRFAIAAGVLAAAAALGPGIRRAQLAAPWRYPLLGGLLSVYFILMFVALRITDPVSTGAVFTLTPILSASFAWLLLRQGVPPRMAFALALGGAGALWVIFDGDLASLLAFRIDRGEAIFFVGVVAHALYTPLVRRLNRGEPAVAFSFWTVSAAFALIALTALATGALGATDWGALPPVVWAAAIYLALGATALTFFLLQFAALRLPSGKVMAYGYLVPSFVVLWEGLFAGQWPPLGVLAGIAATMAAMLLLLRD